MSTASIAALTYRTQRPWLIWLLTAIIWPALGAWTAVMPALCTCLICHVTLGLEFAFVDIWYHWAIFFGLCLPLSGPFSKLMLDSTNRAALPSASDVFPNARGADKLLLAYLDFSEAQYKATVTVLQAIKEL
jgi:hypothetical protein